MAVLRRPALGTARHKPANQDVVLNVSKVASNSSAGAPGIGHLLSLTAVAALLPFRPSSERLGSAQGASNPCSRNRACPVLLSMKREKLRAASDAGRSTVKP